MFEKINAMKAHHQMLFAFLIFFGVLSMWRGVWNLTDRYLFPHDPALSALVSLGLGIAILVPTHYATRELM